MISLLGGQRECSVSCEAKQNQIRFQILGLLCIKRLFLCWDCKIKLNDVVSAQPAAQSSSFLL